MTARQAPWRDGALQHTPTTRWDPATRRYVNHDEWRDIVPFRAHLRLDAMRRRRSSARVIWHDPNGIPYPMFIPDLVALLRTIPVHPDGVNAVWTIQKRGTSYGIRLATPIEAGKL